MDTAIWVIGLIAAVFIVVIYIITSVNKYSKSFVGKYFDEKDKDKNSEGSLNDITEKNETDQKS